MGGEVKGLRSHLLRGDDFCFTRQAYCKQICVTITIMNAKEFCTCKNTKCKYHPLNHELGCTPCIEINLKTNDIPNCYFEKIDPEHKHKGTKIKDFAEFVLHNK